MLGYKLPKTHSQRKDAVRIENKNITGPKIAPLPFWYQRQLQLQANAGIRSDELQSASQIWKPLGLNKE